MRAFYRFFSLGHFEMGIDAFINFHYWQDSVQVHLVNNKDDRSC